MRKFLLMMMSLFVLHVTYAQNNKITGTIRGQNGDPVPFASVTIKGKQIGVTADGEGSFILQNITTGSKLVISAAGYLPQEMVVGDAGSYTITLVQKGSAQLSEVIVTALGIKRQPREVGYSTANIKSDELT